MPPLSGDEIITYIFNRDQIVSECQFSFTEKGSATIPNISYYTII